LSKSRILILGRAAENKLNAFELALLRKRWPRLSTRRVLIRPSGEQINWLTYFSIKNLITDYAVLPWELAGC
jgi:hypothetical protein